MLATFVLTFILTPTVLSADIKDYEDLIAAAKDKEPVELFSGNWIVGEDIAPGRYEITTTDGQNRNLFINKEDANSHVNAILGDSNISVSRVSFYLTGG